MPSKVNFADLHDPQPGSRHHFEVYFVNYCLLASAKCQLLVSCPVTFGLGIKLFLLLEWDM